MTSQAYQKGETALGVQQRDDRAPARITATVQKSSAAIFRNIQPPITFDAISASCATFRNIPAHNAIVISPSHRQAFVTFCNISSAYLSHKGSLCSTFALCDTSELALVRMYYSTPVLLCRYAHTTISAYAHMRIKAYNDSVMKFHDFIAMKF
jgi:hypothetical protein